MYHRLENKPSRPFTAIYAEYPGYEILILSVSLFLNLCYERNVVNIKCRHAQALDPLANVLLVASEFRTHKN